MLLPAHISDLSVLLARPLNHAPTPPSLQPVEEVVVVEEEVVEEAKPVGLRPMFGFLGKVRGDVGGGYLRGATIDRLGGLCVEATVHKRYARGPHST